MSNQGFGFGSGLGGGTGGPGGVGFDMKDLDALARQAWNAWGEQLRAAGAPYQGIAQPSLPGMNEAAAWWSKLAAGGAPQGNDTLDRFNSQASGWLKQMQQLANQLAGHQTSAPDIARMWQQALGDNPFASALGSMQGPGQQGLDQWSAQVAPILQAMQQSGQGLLGLPAFGFTREHQQRWQQLAQAQLDHQQHSKAYQDLLDEAGQQAFKRFEAKLAERSAPGRQLDSARALFDLWIDAAEEAYAQTALSPKFREVYGQFVNSQMRVRASLQHEIEQQCAQLGIPGRTEIDAAHRKMAQMQRELRRLREADDRRARPVSDASVEHELSAAPSSVAAAPNATASKGKASKAPKASAAKAPSSNDAVPATAEKPSSARSAVAQPAAPRGKSPPRPTTAAVQRSTPAGRSTSKPGTPTPRAAPATALTAVKPAATGNAKRKR